MLKIKNHTQFKKDYKEALRSGHNREDFIRIIALLAKQKPLPQKYKDYQLTNSKYFKNIRKCHIKQNLLLIYKKLKTRIYGYH